MVLAADLATVFGLIVGGLGILVTSAGFAVTLWQLKRTKTAAEAAASEARRTQLRVANNYLLVLLPQLVRLESDFYEAARANRRQVAMLHLGSWRWQAAQLVALLRVATPHDAEFLRNLQHSVTLATQAKRVLLEQSTSVLDSTTKVRASMSAVTDRVGELTVALSLGGNSEL